MAPTNLDKALKAEVDALKNLCLLRNQAMSVPDDTERLNHSEQIPRQYHMRLQGVISYYEASVRALIAVSENEEQIATLTTKFTTQRAGLDILAKQLRVAASIDSEDVTENSSRITENKRRVFSHM